MYTILLSKRYFYNWIFVIVAGLLLAGCSSGGSSSGTGSSTVQGNVVSFSVAFIQPADSENFSLTAFLNCFFSATPAFAATAVENIRVDMLQLTTMTDAGGNFKIDGVPAGTHEMRFTKNDQTASMSVEVRENDQVSITHVKINGHQAHADSVSHMNRDDMTPGGGGGTPMH